MSTAENIAVIHERIAAVARRAGRSADGVALMAVTKTHPPEHIREAYAASLRLFGENRVQEFAAKAAALADLDGAKWHMIGHLQTNKAAKAAELFSAVDSVDSLKLAEKLDAAALALGKKLRVLIEINVGGEVAKSGIAIGFERLGRIAAGRATVRGARISRPDDGASVRRQSRRHATLLSQAMRTTRHHRRTQTRAIRMDVLSMGMSHDFEVAIEEGSTCVRVGTAIFGERTKA